MLLLTCSYNSQEFIRVGYYVSNEYPNYNSDSNMPLPSPIDVNKVSRNILANKPRVTRFNIKWDENDSNDNTNNNNNNNNKENNNSNMDEKSNNNNNNNNNFETPMLDKDELAKVAAYEAYETQHPNDSNNNMNNNNNNINNNMNENGMDDDEMHGMEENEEDDDDMLMAD